MVVYEIKDPKPVASGDNVKSIRRNVKPVFPIEPIRPIDSLILKREWAGEKGHEHQGQKEATSKSAIREAQSLITLINSHLEILKKGIHIALRKGDDSFLLDVYDCSDGVICDNVAELPIDIADLPILLKKLQQEAGILLDKKL